MTYPQQPVAPYTPFAVMSPLRAHYQSLVQVVRNRMKIIQGAPSNAWSAVTDIVDPFVDIPGQMMCRIEPDLMRRGDLPMPLVAGRAPDRVGVVFFDVSLNPDTGAPYVLAGDRLYCIAGPIQGTWEIRAVPYASVSLAGAHHVECQVWEVAQSLAKGGFTPFPGSEGPDA